MRESLVFAMSMACFSLAAAQSYQPHFDPAALKGATPGLANEVMVLGTPHLKTLQIDAALAEPLAEQLLGRLAAWQPQAIAIEALSGTQCDFLRRYPQRYGETVHDYCWDPAPARAATGLDVPSATQEWERLLAAWPAAPTPAQRRRLAAVFLAGGENASGLVQWLRLAPAERRTGDGLDAALVAFLQTLEKRGDETALLSARLAARLGLERLLAMDDHTADSSSPDEKASSAAIMKAWDNPATKERMRIDKALRARLVGPDDLLALYRTLNGADQGKLVYDSDFGAALKEPSPQQFGRNYVGYWETRNLRMAANIREALGLQPGRRMLVVVGASHKGYLEAYLHQMHDVRLVDTATLLK